MHRKWRIGAALTPGLAALSALVALPAHAQETGVITGTVIDAETKQPLPDIVVEADSLQGEKPAVTDSSGSYKISQLPPGQYSIRVSADDYKPAAASVLLRDGKTAARQNFMLVPTVHWADIPLDLRRRPIVDTHATNIWLGQEKDYFSRLALSPPGTRAGAVRSFEQLVLVVPRAAADALGVSFDGAPSSENRYQIDGLSVNNVVSGVADTPLPAEFIHVVSNNAEEYMPEIGRTTGRLVDAVTKSGTNELHGSIFSTITPGALQGARALVNRQGSSVQRDSRLGALRDFGFELGGPILKDKLLFYAGVDLALQDDQITLRALDDSGSQRAAPIERKAMASRNSALYLGKLTWNITRDHSLTLSAFGDASSSSGSGDHSLGPARGRSYSDLAGDIGPGDVGEYARQETTLVHDMSLKLATAFMNKRLLLDVGLGWHHAGLDVAPADGSRRGSGEGLRGGPGDSESSAQNRYQGNFTVTFLWPWLGHHVMKAGIDMEVTTLDSTSRSSSGTWFYEDKGGALYAFRAGSPTRPDGALSPAAQRAGSASTIIGGYVQDSYDVFDKVIVNGGVRYDAQVITTSGGAAMTLLSQWSPRVGIAYALPAMGESKLFTSFARYHASVPLGIAAGMLPRPVTASLVDKSRCDPRDPASRAACEAPASRLDNGASYDPNQKWIVRGSGQAAVDPELEGQSTDEITAGAEFAVFDGGRLNITYVHRYLNQVIEDVSRDQGATFLIGNPGFGAARDFPAAKRDYDGVTLTFQKPFSSHWLAAASYTLSSLRGNYEGFLGPAGGASSPNHTPAFDDALLMQNSDGPLPGDHTHAIKLHGATQFWPQPSVLISLGLSHQAFSGGPINVLSAGPLYGGGGAFILPRGAGGRLPWVQTIDTNVTVAYRLSRKAALVLGLDVFNLFNFQEVTSRDEIYTTERVRPIAGGTLADLPGELRDERSGAPIPGDVRNKSYGRPTSYQSPRQLRFSARVMF